MTVYASPHDPSGLYRSPARVSPKVFHWRKLRISRPTVHDSKLGTIWQTTRENTLIRALIKKLCQQIEVEKDHHFFSELVAELNELLERKNKRLDHPPFPTAPKA